LSEINQTSPAPEEENNKDKKEESQEKPSMASTTESSSLTEQKLLPKTGFLWKSGGKNRKYPGKWQKRWFSLKPYSLTYYKTPTDVDPSGEIDLQQVLNVNPGSENEIKKKNSLILTTSHRTFWLYATSKQEQDEWMELLHQYISQIAKPSTVNC